MFVHCSEFSHYKTAHFHFLYNETETKEWCKVRYQMKLKNKIWIQVQQLFIFRFEHTTPLLDKVFLQFFKTKHKQ